MKEKDNILESISKGLSNAKDKTNSDSMSAYMKNNFKFYGVKSPERNKILKPIWSEYKTAIKAEFRPIVQELWKKDQREYQMIAMDILAKCKRLTYSDDLPFIKNLILTKSWWDTVDFLASTSIGHILKNDKAQAVISANSFYDQGELWLQRTALLFQLKYKSDTDEVLLYDLIKRTFGSKEFFINKASGWALRQYSKFNKDSVRQFINENQGKMAPLTIREGSKYL